MGGQYLSDDLTSHFEERGIERQLTTADTPQQNGVAERMNRTLMNLVRSMLVHKKLPKCFWAEALSTATYIRNRVTSRAIEDGKNPHHLWKGFIPSVKHLRVFGSNCWYVLPGEKLQKLDSRSRSAIFVGYADHSKAYKLLDWDSWKPIVSRDVIFDENSMPEIEMYQFGSEIKDDEDNSGNFVCLDMGVEEDVDDFEGPERSTNDVVPEARGATEIESPAKIEETENNSEIDIENVENVEDPSLLSQKKFLLEMVMNT